MIKQFFRWAGGTVEHFQALKGNIKVLSRSHRLPSILFNAAQRVASKITSRTPKVWTYATEGGAISWHRRIESVPSMEAGSWLLLARNIHLLTLYVEMAKRRGLLFQHRQAISIHTQDVRKIVAYEQLRAGKAVEPDIAGQVLIALGRPTGFLDPEAGGYTADELGPVPAYAHMACSPNQDTTAP